MPRKSGAKPPSNFGKGLVTEFTALSFPQDACTETFNCVFSKTGSTERRPGLKVETGGTETSLATTSTAAYVEYNWTGVAGSGSKSFLVQQHGRYLRFFDTSDNMIPSANIESFTVDLNSYRPGSPTIDPATEPCAFDQGDGKLFVVNRGIDPIYVTYTASSNTIAVTAIAVQERDFYGAPETGWDDDERYTGNVAALIAADSNHLYNLYNQGWFISLKIVATSANAPLLLWDAGRADLPSNSDTPWLYLNTLGAITDVFNVGVVGSRGPGSVKASKGHFLLDVFTQSRTGTMSTWDATYALTVTGDRTDDKERFQAVAFFAGRVWYAGAVSSDLNTKIFFSRIVETVDHYGQAYQENDPTSQTLTDLLPSDGGVIRIPEIDQIIKMYSFRTTLLIFATNGVWAISGSTGTGFKANDYVVKKLSSLGTHSRLSFMDFKGTPVWWGDDGVMSVKYDPNYDSFTVENLTFSSIWSFFQAIPKENRKYAKGAYDARNEIGYWIYRNGDIDSTTRYTYDSVLVMNGFSGAFYPWTVESTEKLIRGMLYVQQADGGGTPIVKITTTDPINATTEYLTYGECSSLTYLDWAVDNYTSYFITGAAVDGDAQRFFQANYIWVYLEPTANSSCFMQGLYDFANAEASGKWSTVQQIYNSSMTLRNLNHRRLKVRGKGKALQLKFTSEEGKPFFIAGWSVWETQNADI